MEPGRDPAAMVCRPKKKAFRVLLPPSSGPPARIPALPPKTYFKVLVLFFVSRFKKRKHTSLFYEKPIIVDGTILDWR
jgi:hypothetical protein